MSKKSFAIFLAILVSAMPYLGFSSEINDIYYTTAGIIIAALIHLSSIHYCAGCQSKIDNGMVEETSEDVNLEEDKIEELDVKNEEYVEELEKENKKQND